jgi:hypothetical protein
VRRTRHVLILLLACAYLLPTAAHAAQSASLHVTFTPERLGQSTSMRFGVQITAPAGRVPPPLTELDVRYPSDLGLAASGLGLTTCSEATVQALGPAGCPADSRMGHGKALAEIPFGPDIIQETAAVNILRAPEQAGQLAMFFYATGVTPVDTQIVLPALLRPGPAPSNEDIRIDVPLVPSLPTAPDVAVVALHATLGPQGLTYYERVHGEPVAYHPRGILLPHKCPRKGFAFSASLTFLDGSHANAETSVPCPRGR